MPSTTNLIDTSISLTNGISITEDTILVDPNVNVRNLKPYSLTASKTMGKKEQPYHLANEISGAGNAGALLMIQNVNTGTVSHMCNTFYLQAMDIQLKERVQIMETFGKPIASFFGESAKVYNFSGVCLEADSKRTGRHKGEYFHGTSLLYLYETYMRGSKLIDGASIAILQVSNHSVYGYPIQFSYRAMGDLDKAIQFSFSFFVKEHLYEIPGIVSKSLMQSNIRMGSSKNPNVRKLEGLRETLKKILDGFDERRKKKWLDANQLSQEDRSTQAVVGIYTSKVGQTINEAITGNEAAFMIDVSDYTLQLKEMFGKVQPSAQQASAFGLHKVHANLIDGDETGFWTDGLKAELKMAWAWMPWADTPGAQQLVTGDNEDLMKEQIDNSQWTTDNLTEMLQLEGSMAWDNIKYWIGEQGTNGAYAAMINQTMKTVDTTLYRKLQYYWMNYDNTLAADIKDLDLSLV